VDGLNEHLDSPLHWAALVIADHFEYGEDGYSATPEEIRAVVDQSFEFITAAFNDEGLDAPLPESIEKAAIELIQCR
jgi:hypothetical protein